MKPLALIFIALCIAASVRAEDPLDARIRETVEASPNHYLNSADARSAFVDELRSVSAETGVDAALLERLAFWESSYLPDAVGSRGERGLLQVHPSSAQGCDFSTRRGGLLCGARILEEALQRCGSIEGALTSHATRGQCRTKNKRVKAKIAWRIGEIE